MAEEIGMTVKAMKQMKVNCEEEIRNIVLAFERRTGIHVKEIDIPGRSGAPMEVTLKLDVR